MSLLLESSNCFVSMHRHNEKIKCRKNQLRRLGLGNKIKYQDKLLLKSVEDLMQLRKVSIIYTLGLCSVNLG